MSSLAHVLPTINYLVLLSLTDPMTSLLISLHFPPSYVLRVVVMVVVVVQSSVPLVLLPRDHPVVDAWLAPMVHPDKG